MAPRIDFDELAKEVARGLPRREALRRLGVAMTGALFAPLGLALDGEQPARAQRNSTRAHDRRAGKQADKPHLPQIVDVMAFRSKSSARVLLYFTAEQWKEAIRDAKEVGGLKPEQVALEAAPMPGGDGAILLAPRGCPAGTSPVMLYSPAPGSASLTPLPDDLGNISPTCISNPNSGLPNRPLPADTACQMQVGISGGPSGRHFTLYCASVHCSVQCQLVRQQQGGGSGHYGCVCGP